MRCLVRVRTLDGASAGAPTRACAVISAISLALAACIDSTGSAGARNSVSLRSDPSDPVGAGTSYDYTQANAVFSVGTTGVPTTLGVELFGDLSWRGSFTMPSGMTRVTSGTYTEGFFWYNITPGSYIVCPGLLGSFTLDNVRYDSTRLTAVDVGFEQHCDSTSSPSRTRSPGRASSTR